MIFLILLSLTFSFCYWLEFQFLLDVSLAYERDRQELSHVIAVGGEWGRAAGGRRLIVEDYFVPEH